MAGRSLVLMYHGTPPDAPHSRYALNADRFRSHLELLQAHGWTVVSLGELLAGAHARPRTLAITFDDGYADNFDGAFRPLLERDMKATWFITTSCIGGHAGWDGPPSQQNRMLTAEQIREMDSAGMEIASHSHTHPDFARLSHSEQAEEARLSRSILEELLQHPISGFAYPYGRFGEETPRILREAGYEWACTTRSGWYRPEEDPYLVRRVTIFSEDTASHLARKLQFADNDVSWRRLAKYYACRIKDRARFWGKP